MSWWDIVSSRLKEGDVLFTPGRGKEGHRRKPFEIISITSIDIVILSSKSSIQSERKCFDTIEAEYLRNPMSAFRVAALHDRPLPDSADKLIREATGNDLARGNYVCSILERCGLVRYEIQGNKKFIVLNSEESI